MADEPPPPYTDTTKPPLPKRSTARLSAPILRSDYGDDKAALKDRSRLTGLADTLQTLGAKLQLAGDDLREKPSISAARPQLRHICEALHTGLAAVRSAPDKPLPPPPASRPVASRRRRNRALPPLPLPLPQSHGASAASTHAPRAPTLYVTANSRGQLVLSDPAGRPVVLPGLGASGGAADGRAAVAVGGRTGREQDRSRRHTGMRH